jgi:hypothetical protein
MLFSTILVTFLGAALAVPATVDSSIASIKKCKKLVQRKAW